MGLKTISFNMKLRGYYYSHLFISCCKMFTIKMYITLVNQVGNSSQHN